MSKWIRDGNYLYNVDCIENMQFSDLGTNSKRIRIYFTDDHADIACESDYAFERLVAWLEDRGASWVLDMTVEE